MMFEGADVTQIATVKRSELVCAEQRTVAIVCSDQPGERP